MVGAGKASAAMAEVLDDALAGVSDSLVLVPYGHERTCRSVNIVEASHPVPDAAGQKGAQKILDLASSLGRPGVHLGWICKYPSSLFAARATGDGGGQ